MKKLLSLLIVFILAAPVQASPQTKYLRNLISYGGGDVNRDGTINGKDWILMDQEERVATVAAFFLTQHNANVTNLNKLQLNTLQVMIAAVTVEVNDLYTNRYNRSMSAYDICRKAASRISGRWGN